MKLRTAAFSLLTIFVPGALATPVYDLWDLYNSKLTSLEGWGGLKVENLFGEGTRVLSFDNPGGGQLSVEPGQVHLLGQLTDSAAGGAASGGIYTLNLMFQGLTVGSGGASLAAGFGNGGSYVLGTLTTPDGQVFHIATGTGVDPALTLGANGSGDGLAANGVLRFCSDASCQTLLGDALGTLSLGAGCAAGSDCSGLPGGNNGGGSTGGGGSVMELGNPIQILELALAPESQTSPEVPEPATYCMLGAGLLGLSMLKRRRRVS